MAAHTVWTAERLGALSLASADLGAVTLLRSGPLRNGSDARAPLPAVFAGRVQAAHLAVWAIEGADPHEPFCAEWLLDYGSIKDARAAFKDLRKKFPLLPGRMGNAGFGDESTLVAADGTPDQPRSNGNRDDSPVASLGFLFRRGSVVALTLAALGADPEADLQPLATQTAMLDERIVDETEATAASASATAATFVTRWDAAALRDVSWRCRSWGSSSGVARWSAS